MVKSLAMFKWSGQLSALLSPRSLFFSFVALFILRFAIGYHFFHEGTIKRTSGDFDARHFLVAAKGPFARHFHSLVDDHDGRLRLCYSMHIDEQENRRPKLDTELTFLFWRQFLNDADKQYKFESNESVKKVESRLGKVLEELRVAKNADPVDRSAVSKLEYELEQLKADVIEMRGQRDAANDILDLYEKQLTEYLEANRDEILAYFKGEERNDGFDRDGPNRKDVANSVESLMGQVKSIQTDRQKKAAGWLRDIENMWNGLEHDLNQLATTEQKRGGTVTLYRPFDPPNSKLRTINKIVPWFDTILGVLLMIGLFTRISSLLGAGFLATIVITQPPWVLGAAPTFYQCIELAGLLVVFAACAGRCGGIDYFIHKLWNSYKRDSVSDNEYNS